tara:strand:- start:3625 stop:3831 length:207 start_codon:yes stop_codon:yes gene_type:complete
MANLIEGISNLPLEQQEIILKSLTKKLVVIEIDEDMFLVQEEINELIDSLSKQVIILTEQLYTWKKEK